MWEATGNLTQYSCDFWYKDQVTLLCSHVTQEGAHMHKVCKHKIQVVEGSPGLHVEAQLLLKVTTKADLKMGETPSALSRL